MLVAFYTIIALLFGSFTNVLIYRCPKEISIIKPGSFCPECKHEISWLEKLPIISYVLLGAKCKNCKTKIPIHYPLVELAVVLFSYKFILKAAHNSILIQKLNSNNLEQIITQFLNFLDFLFPLILISIVVALAVIDQKENLLPHKLTYSGIVLAMIFIGTFGTSYYESSEYFSVVLNGYFEALLSCLMQLGIVFFSFDAFIHLANKIYYKEDGLEIASSGLTLGLKFIEKKITIFYLLVIILVLTLLINFQDLWIHYLFVLIGLSYLVNEIFRDYFFASPAKKSDLEREEIWKNKKTVLGGGDVAMIAMIGVVFGVSKTLLIVLVAFYIVFVFLMLKFLKIFFETAFRKETDGRPNGMQILKDNLARHIPLGGALALSFIAAMMIFG